MISFASQAYLRPGAYRPKAVLTDDFKQTKVSSHLHLGVLRFLESIVSQNRQTERLHHGQQEWARGLP